MKRLFNAVFLSATMMGVGALPTFAKIERVGNWSLDAPQEVSFVCGGSIYTHTLSSISVDEDGSFAGTGVYNNDNATTWDITGNINGDQVTFTLVYTGANPGYTLTGSGTIGADGSITGNITSGNCETFTMDAASALRFNGNHGQYVKSQDDKKMAAHSRLGMPVKSMGHTKTFGQSSTTPTHGKGQNK